MYEQGSLRPVGGTSSVTAGISPLWLPVLTTFLVGALFVILSDETLTWVILVVLAVASVAGTFIYGDPKRLLLFLLVFLLPFDISKALVVSGGIYAPGLSLYLSDMPLLTLLVINLMESAFITHRWFRLTRLEKIAVVFVAWLWISSLYSQAPVIGLFSAISYTKYLFAFLLVSRAVKSYSELRLVLIAMFAAFVVQFLYVAAQFLTGSNLEIQGAKATEVGTRLLFDAAEGVSAFRPSGFLHHPNVLADYVTFLLPIAMAFSLLGKRWLPSKIWLGSLFVLVGGLAMLIITLSRGGWIAFSVSALFIILVGLRRGFVGQAHITIGIAGLLVGLAILVMAYPQAILRITQSDFRSTESRLVMADQALLIIRSNPILGVGYGGYNGAAQTYIPEAFSYVSKAFQEELQRGIVHNYYLLLTAEVGIPFALFWLYMMFNFIRQAFPLTQWRSPAMYALALGLAAALIAQTVFHLFDHFYGDFRISMLWLVTGLLQAMVRINATARPVAAVLSK